MDPIFMILGSLIAFGWMSSFVSSRRLRQWAEAEGAKILKKRYAAGLGNQLYARGLFAGWCYYVKIEDRDGNVFSGWVQVGGILAALRHAKFKVEWDNRPGYLRDE